MTDKEERILIDIIEPGLNCVYRMDNNPKGLSLCKHNGEEEPVSEKDCKSCLEGITRQEAIGVIKKSLKQIQCWPDSFNDIIAEAALNALLGGGK